ncbi:MAG: glycosyltransferase family protein [Ignavibacteriales bacterium]|nr:glycosyltransferase family protein [Ignavibacteriales bacterium]
MKIEKQDLGITAIVQARSGSTRLPGKILKKIYNEPILWHVVNRLSYSKLINKIIIATTDLAEDDQIQEFCEANKFLFYRGSSEDVLSRYFNAAKSFEAKIIVRITSDCPVIDYSIVDRMLEIFIFENRLNKLDYLSNVLPRTFPRGLDTEIFTFAVLERTYNEANQVYEHEHVTPYIYNHPAQFAIKNFSNEKDYSIHRWTVDTQEDFNLIEEIYKSLYEKNKIFLFEDILKLFEEQPDLIRINQNIQQKRIGE